MKTIEVDSSRAGEVRMWDVPAICLGTGDVSYELFYFILGHGDLHHMCER